MNLSKSYFHAFNHLRIRGLVYCWLCVIALHATQAKTITWENPDFIGQFAGSATFDPATEPKIQRDEQNLLKKLQPRIQEDLQTVIIELEAALDEQSSAAMHYYLGGFYLKMNRLREAEQQLHIAVRKFPSFMRAYQSLAATAVDRQAYADAIDALGKAISLGANQDKMYGLLGYCYLQEGLYKAALSAYEQAIMLNANHQQWLQGEIQCLFELHRNREALSAIDQLLLWSNDPAGLLALKARTWLNLEEPEQAINLFEQARLYAKLSPEDAMLLADVYLSEKVFKDAGLIYQNLIETDPTSLDLNKILTRVESFADYEQWELLSELITTVKASFSFNSEAQAGLSILEAKKEMAIGNASRAREILQAVIENNPLDGKVLLLLAKHCHEVNENAQAEIYYKRASSLDSSKRAASIGLAKLKIEERNYGEAILLLQQAHRIKPNDHLLDYIETLKDFSNTSK